MPPSIGQHVKPSTPTPDSRAASGLPKADMADDLSRIMEVPAMEHWSLRLLLMPLIALLFAPTLADDYADTIKVRRGPKRSVLH